MNATTPALPASSQSRSLRRRQMNARRPGHAGRAFCLLGTGERSDRQQVAGSRIGARVAKFRHRPGLDLADALPSEVEVFTDFLERAGLAAIEPEAQGEDLALTLVQRRQELLDLGRQQGGRRDLEG